VGRVANRKAASGFRSLELRCPALAEGRLPQRNGPAAVWDAAGP